MASAGQGAGVAPAQRYGMLALIAVCLVLIAAHVALYTPLLAQSGVAVYLAEPISLLLLYAGLVVLATRAAAAARRAALREGAAFGVASGTLWAANQFVETFANVSGAGGIAATAPFLVGGFALWGAAAFRAARRTGSGGLGVLAAAWAGMLCVLLTILVGLTIAFAALARLERELASDPDFARTGWADVHAFVVANAFDAAFSHLVGALVVGGIVGAAGAGLGLLVRRGVSSTRPAPPAAGEEA